MPGEGPKGLDWLDGCLKDDVAFRCLTGTLRFSQLYLLLEEVYPMVCMLFLLLRKNTSTKHSK